jgi:hypothetical protein
MNNQNNLGSYLLFPPAVLWLFMLLLMFDNTLAEYIFSRIDLQVMDIIYYIAGLVFPAAALVVGIRGALQKEQKERKLYNYTIIVISSLMLTLMILMVFAF